MSNVWVFFYGTFMSSKILKKHGIDCDETFPAKISGYSLSIRPRVNLTKSIDSNCFGGLAFIKHGQLTNLYQEVYKTFGQIYYPYPVLAELEDGSYRQSLCFISDPFDSGAPEQNYLTEMIECARQMKAPSNYIEHIRSFGK